MTEDQIFEYADPEIEFRSFEVRAESDTREIFGTLMPYNQITTIANLFREQVYPGAFKKYLDSDKGTWMTRQHVRAFTLGRVGANVELEDNNERLSFRATMPNTPMGDETLTLIRDGIITGASVEMPVSRVSWQGDLRNIIEALLPRFSIVDAGQYDGTKVSARALEFVKSITDPTPPKRHRRIWQ